MQLEWPPFTINPEDFSPGKLVSTYLDVGVVASEWDVILQGVLVTISLALLAEVFGGLLGLFLALLKISRSPVLRLPAQLYIDVFRGTPLLVQITIIYFSVAPVGFRWESLFFAGLAALSLNSAAYVAEIFRSGIQSIDKGQMEAGRASGLTYAQTMRHIIVPQAFRRTIPPLTNEFVMLIKDTSLVSVIGLVELLRAAQEIQSQTFNSSALTAAALIYLMICLPLIYLTNALERRLNRRTA
ncbi:MAG: amino acid ABC transporter permease [Actinomycetota bacterium]|jgi:polar amino acid transport system permease protein|nr:amino acid ABC transporter permease [Rubrobacter sp.]MDQ3236403.1 amino acid ABC transporter permease [Actinomycetota bacterium]MDQ3567646.1 amino acid ABC transporter permease [Actinomycetota bacterium]